MIRPRPPVVPEKVEQAHIVRLLRSLGGQVYVLGTHRRRGDHPGTMQTPGLPDLIAFLPRIPGVLCVEVKSARGRLRPEQAAFRASCLAIGPPVYHVVGGLNAVLAQLVALGLLRADQVPAHRLPTPAAVAPIRACRLVPIPEGAIL